MLATVLDLDGHSSEDALRKLRTVLKARPEYADARYLLGKILLASGSGRRGRRTARDRRATRA